MDWTVCSRETERDYTWDNTHASHLLPEYAQGHFSPAFEGSLTTSRVATLFRCHGVLLGVVLGVSVDTLRKDFRNRPIRTMAFLRAENDDEAKLLAAFFAECLHTSDTETLYNEKSDVAKAVESIYKTKKLDDFMQFCGSLPTVNGGGVKLADRWAIPRGYMTDRSALVESLPALIRDNKPFLLALTDRLPTDVLASLGSMFDRATVRIFSKATSRKERIPEPPQKYGRAATIGGIVVLSILFVAAIGTCSRGGRQGEAKSPAGGGTNAPASRQDSVGRISPAATNSPTQEATLTNVLSTSQESSDVYVSPASTNAPLQEVAVTNALLSSQKGLGGPVTSAVTNTLQQKEAVTNSLKTASDGTGKRKTENE